ncbi:pentatricopeptide repeat-containing protein At4g21065-like [Amborella trichopoda]|uniref:pentatricopeptide repeat-containing protein At4g21065-like n=1 Tax=Amborella trichopoda TaxID=13333 RepID=UPI0005D3656C|nr:pentatricopeptide repeat-containing protein At4g21065-like [Amborella trichopoda]|eukprot:XP_011621023.1 pentatricopeptide repeat-containing protein At4g21065-like [Amborella trichopoda]
MIRNLRHAYLQPLHTFSLSISGSFHSSRSLFTHSNPSPSLSLLADRCTSMRTILQIHAQMIVTARILDNYAASRLIAFASLSENGDLKYAFQVFRSIEQPNLFMWNTLIQAHAQAREPWLAIILYKTLRARAISPGEHTFPFLLKASARIISFSTATQLHAHIIHLGFETDVYVSNGLLHVYCSCGLLTDARKVFDEIPQRNVIIFTTMISGYAQNCEPKKALGIFNDMGFAAVEPNEITLCSVLSACSKSGDLELGRDIHNNYIQREGVELGPILGTALVDMYAKNGCIEAATEVFHEMHEKNTATWNAMICGLAMHGHVSDALKLFHEMVGVEKVAPNDITFVGVLSACCHAGLVGVGREIFESMKRAYGVEPKIEHYGCMVDLLGRAGLVEEAERLINSMAPPLRPDVTILGALLGACRKHGKIDIAERVVEHVLKIEPENHGVYVLLSNMHAEAGRWGEVVRLRKVMRTQGLKKVPGFSLVEANN